MKRVLGLDLGTTSIGWAVVEEAENRDEKSSIIRVGSRVNPLTTDEKSDFEKGKPITTNAGRALKRGMRRSNQRFKLRRQDLLNIMLEKGWITKETVLAEHGNRTTFETLRLRAKAVEQEISLEEFARVLLMMNKKRGYKSNRKTNDNDEGQSIDGLAVAKELHQSAITPGQFILKRMQEDKFRTPDFYGSDLMVEFDKIWEVQSHFYPDCLTDNFKRELNGKNRTQTWGVCRQYLGVEGAKRTKKGRDLEKENYEWRVKALSEQIGLEELTIVFQSINDQIQKSSTYLGKISDRHKELFFNNKTVGQYLVARLDENPNFSLKNTVFYRQDYIDEYDKVWNKQAEYHKELTEDLKKEISEAIIFYQRPLKSKKGLVSTCEFESHEQVFVIDGKKTIKTVGLKVLPKSSPLFQEFKVWQVVNNVTINNEPLSLEQKNKLFSELNTKPKMSKRDALKLLSGKTTGDTNYENFEGNKTQATLLEACSTIIEDCGYDKYDFSKMSSANAYEIIEEIFQSLGYKTDFLHFDACKEDPEYQKQPAYKLWHLIYSYEGDKSVTGVEGLVDKICTLTDFSKDHARILAKITFTPDYGNLSSKAVRKIMPFLRQGYKYSEACELAGYRHSKSSLTKEELDAKELKNRLELLPKNSLRNPVVEKILNQMVNVVNAVIDEFGKPDEIRIELARELKKSAKEREEMTNGISKAEKLNKEYREIIKTKFQIAEPSRNDIIRYKLYEELCANGYKTLYSDTYIPVEKLFYGNDFDIEHIIPQAKLFDDSFSNKTLEAKQINIDKGNSTALDFVKSRYGEEKLREYKDRVNHLYSEGKISKAKKEHLLMTETDIPVGFIDRDLRDTQYIARKAKSMLEEIVRDVVTTTGAITDRLREDWQLINVMQELNWDKYNKKGLTYYYEDKDKRKIPRIKDWTKRNDHRHHAMDALVIAFTKRSYIQYLNNLNARIPKGREDGSFVDLSEQSLSDLPFKQRQQVVRSIENTQLMRDDKGKLRFIPPMPADEFRAEAKKQLDNCLISIKAKNKVVTRNINKTKKVGGGMVKIQLTPRGQLHNETVYGKINRYETKMEKVGSTFTADKIAEVANKSYREALSKRLESFGNDPKKAFTGKNSLDKTPLYLDESHLSHVPERIKTVRSLGIYTVRKPIDKDLKIDKVIDEGIKRILQARLAEYDNDTAKAFSNLDKNPIWLNKEKGIQIKRVTISGVNNAVPLHDKVNHLGNKVLDASGKPIPTDYVSTSNNHHIAIFIDEDGNLQEHVVSFYEAVVRANLGIPVIDKEYNNLKGWKFLFTMKQNEYFVFPNETTQFNPNDIDLLDTDNYKLISPNLFRVQKLSTKYYVFRHHLETTVEDNEQLRGITWKRITAVNDLRNVVKVRLNHIGQIVQMGEY